jgi:hypothetical protein
MTDATPAEQGFPTNDSPDPSGHLPPGLGRWSVPYFELFSSRFQANSRSYRYQFDEALRDGQANCDAIRRDPTIMAALEARKMPSVQSAWNLEPDDETNPLEVEAAVGLTKVIERIPRFQQIKYQLLDALFYGRSAVQLIYGWDFRGGRKSLKVVDSVPVHGDSVRFKWDGRVGFTVHSSYEGETESTDYGRVHWLTPTERESTVVHFHDIEPAPFHQGEQAGRIKGVGVRDRLYWLWYLKVQTFALLNDYLQLTSAGGTTIYFYESGNPTSLEEVREAAQSQQANSAILFPRDRTNPTAGPGIQRIEAGTAGANLLQSLVTGFYDDQITRYILGQELSYSAGGTGLGSGVADFHSETLARILKYDLQNLADTFNADLIPVLCRYCYPGITPPTFAFETDKPNIAEYLESAQTVYSMNGAIDGDDLMKVAGLPKPKPGHTVLTQMTPMSPTGIGQSPDGVPSTDPAGPVDPSSPDATQSPPESVQYRRRR